MAGFIQEEVQILTPDVPNDFRHALCVGETGSGKTSSFILPNVLDRIQRGYGLFIIDFKGNLHSQVKALAYRESRLEDVIEIGVPWGSSINIFKNISRSMFINALNEINGKDGERFWITSALNLAGQFYDAFALLQNLKDLLREKYTLCVSYTFDPVSMNRILSGHNEMEAFLNEVRYILDELTFKQLLALRETGMRDNHLHLIRQFSTELEEVLDKLTSFHKEIDPSSPASGSGGVLFCLRNIMHTFTQIGMDGKDDLHTYLESGKIIILRSESFDENIINALMHIVYKRLLTRESKRGISLFIDEFQRTVSESNIPYIDVFREMKVELIAAMQNIYQLENRITQEKSHEFLGNILHNFYYADHRENTLKTFEFIHARRTAKAEPLFIKKTDLVRAQILWQRYSNAPLPSFWIYERYDGHKRAIIYNVKTGKRKYHYILSHKDSLLQTHIESHLLHHKAS